LDYCAAAAAAGHRPRVDGFYTSSIRAFSLQQLGDVSRYQRNPIKTKGKAKRQVLAIALLT